jgi:uncharacterized Tic20 family protein
MMDTTTDLTTSDERLMGAIAHFFGVLAALIIWALQKDKSKFVRFQAVQALAFDFAVMIFSGILSVCLMGIIVLSVIGSFFTMTNSSSLNDAVPSFFILSFLFPFGFFACLFPYSLVLLAARAFASGSVLSGHDFHYPILGKLVENFLRE